MKLKYFPGYRSEFDKRATIMKYPNQFDKKNIDIGSKTKVKPKSVIVKDTKTGQVYGVRTIMSKESDNQMILLKSLLEGDFSALPEKVIDEIRKNIRKGASDEAQQWKNALELTQKAYQVSNIRLPRPDEKGAWSQFEDNIAYAVKQLSEYRGLQGDWRLTQSTLSDTGMIGEDFDEETGDYQQELGDVGTNRYFVEIPGEASTEVAAKDMDEIIDQLTNKLKRNGAIVRVDQRDENRAVLSVWVDDVKRDKITVKKVS